MSSQHVMFGHSSKIVSRMEHIFAHRHRLTNRDACLGGAQAGPAVLLDLPWEPSQFLIWGRYQVSNFPSDFPRELYRKSHQSISKNTGSSENDQQVPNPDLAQILQVTTVLHFSSWMPSPCLSANASKSCRSDSWAPHPKTQLHP